MTNYDNIPESLKLLSEVLSTYEPNGKFSYKEWMEVVNALDYVAMKLGYTECRNSNFKKIEAKTIID